jgi:hypothetical protein
MYVPRSHEPEMRTAVDAWRRMREIMAELSQQNREAMRAQLRPKRGSRD